VSPPVISSVYIFLTLFSVGNNGIFVLSCTDEEMDRMAKEWLRPFTMEEIHQRMDEAEAEIEAGEVMTSEEVFAEMERKYPWLCK